MRILSYNIHKGIGGRDRRYRLERVLEVIAREEPDVVCLQEVDRHVRRSRFDDQPRTLARALGQEHLLYQMNVHLKTGGYGNLILSRLPFRSHHQISLRMNRRKPRGAQIVVVETAGGPLQVVNWHLGLAERERVWQVEKLLRHRLFREASHLPAILTGDTNDWRNMLGSRVLAAAGFRQATEPVPRFRSFPAWLAMGSLDKAFCRGNLRVKHSRIVRTPAARVASDHLPLVLDVELSEEGAASSETPAAHHHPQ